MYHAHTPARPRPCSAGPRGRRALCCRSYQTYELRICINRTCKRQGSEQVLKFAQDLGIPSIKASPTGCLGNCGSGPNMVLLPQEQLLNHVATPNDLAQCLQAFCSTDVDSTILEATQLRLAGNSYAANNEYQKAIDCYTRALALQPHSGRHLLYSNRSAAHLQAGDKEAALLDAQAAVELAPHGFHNAHIRLIDSLYALGRYGEAAEACRRAAAVDSSFKFRSEYPMIKRALQGAGQRM